MVDSLEFENMQCDDVRDIPVIVKWFPIYDSWSICHEKSHQSAFRIHVNMFDSREEAIAFAENHDCVVTNKGDV